jgi:hypothetical protein
LKVHSIRKRKLPRSHFEFLNETEITQINCHLDHTNYWGKLIKHFSVVFCIICVISVSFRNSKWLLGNLRFLIEWTFYRLSDCCLMPIGLCSSYMLDTHTYAYRLYHCNVLRCKVYLCEDRIYDRWECTNQWSSWISDQLRHKLVDLSTNRQSIITNTSFVFCTIYYCHLFCVRRHRLYP